MKKKIQSLLVLLMIISFSFCSFAEIVSTKSNATENLELKQTTIHPGENDYFGDKSNVVPIMRVIVNSDDEKRKNKICLTFDSAFINKYTYKILDILDEYEIKCTFFMTSGFMRGNKEQVKEILRRGHEIGNHTKNHPNLNLTKDEQVIQEIMDCHNVFKEITGNDMCLFRYPYGSYTERTLNIVKQLGYYPIQWTVDSLDWKNTNVEDIVNRIAKNDNKITEGSIILFHNGATYTPEALPIILEYLKIKNLTPVKVSDLIYDTNFKISGGNQIKLE